MSLSAVSSTVVSPEAELAKLQAELEDDTRLLNMVYANQRFAANCAQEAWEQVRRGRDNGFDYGRSARGHNETVHKSQALALEIHEKIDRTTARIKELSKALKPG